MSAKKKWHGWIVRKDVEGFNSTWSVEYNEPINSQGDFIRKRLKMPSATEAIEFFDGFAGKEVKLIDTPLGAYRVYTEEEDNKA